MKAYIRGLGAITPQHTFSANRLPESVVTSEINRFRCIEPSYLDFLNPVMARRMGRIIKMGIASAMICLKDAKTAIPDAIVAGTALGCLGDTEKFLTAIIEDDEQYLTPTSFIQSIQNSVSAQIALQINCTGHNFTFVHKGFSFESALLDSLLLLEEKAAKVVLTGGLDEMTEHNYLFYDKLGIWKKEKVQSSSLYESQTTGTIGGEGSVFFVLGDAPHENDYAVLRDVKTLYNPGTPNEIEQMIEESLDMNGLNKNDVDLVLFGNNGDVESDKIYNSVRSGMFNRTPAGFFKHLCGEYQTSGAFAMWISSIMLKYGNIPEYIMLQNGTPVSLKNVLVVNGYGNNFAIYLISKN